MELLAKNIMVQSPTVHVQLEWLMLITNGQHFSTTKKCLLTTILVQCKLLGHVDIPTGTRFSAMWAAHLVVAGGRTMYDCELGTLLAVWILLVYPSFITVS